MKIIGYGGRGEELVKTEPARYTPRPAPGSSGNRKHPERRVDVLAQAEELTLYRKYERDKTDRIIAGIVVAQVLYGSPTNPDYLLLVVDEAIRRWHRYLDLLEDQPHRHHEPVTPRGRALALQRFIDNYTSEIEGGLDLDDDLRARVWLAHAVRLAPPDHPIHTSEAVRSGEGPGVERPVSEVY